MTPLVKLHRGPGDLPPMSDELRAAVDRFLGGMAAAREVLGPERFREAVAAAHAALLADPDLPPEFAEVLLPLWSELAGFEDA